ncbi:hypothetical protein BS78_06G139000 [Paspalum vaginatum]|nr:hypothetical protein BS78_06G139000 [Paspalum vaginatum]
MPAGLTHRHGCRLIVLILGNLGLSSPLRQSHFPGSSVGPSTSGVPCALLERRHARICVAAVALFEQRHAQRPHTSIRIAAHGRRGEATAMRIYNSMNLRGGNSNADANLSRCPPRRATTRTRWLCASEEPAPVLPPSLPRCRRSPSLASQRLRPLHQSSSSVLLTAAPRRRNKPVNSPRWQRSGRAPAPHCSGTAMRGARVTTLRSGGPGAKEQAASAQGGSGGSSGGLAPGAAAASRVVVTAWRNGGFSKAERRG